MQTLKYGYLTHILSVYFDSLTFSLEFVHHTMLVIQKDFTRLKRYIEEQHPIIFQDKSNWLLRMFRQYQKIKKQQERDYQTPEKEPKIAAQSEAETATRRIEPRTKNAISAKR
jgi:hypothetical protein